MITLEQSIKSLRRAQELVDKGVIGQAYSLLAMRAPNGKPCFCAIGAIAADRLQPTIRTYAKHLGAESNQLHMDSSQVAGEIEHLRRIMCLNDKDKLTFAQIADHLESLNAVINEDKENTKEMWINGW